MKQLLKYLEDIYIFLDTPLVKWYVNCPRNVHACNLDALADFFKILFIFANKSIKKNT